MHVFRIGRGVFGREIKEKVYFKIPDSKKSNMHAIYLIFRYLVHGVKLYMLLNILTHECLPSNKQDIAISADPDQMPHVAYLKAPITIAADDIHKYFSLFFREIRLDVSSESSARQRIHMKSQALFSLKDKK